jgi:hypothetical protein
MLKSKCLRLVPLAVLTRLAVSIARLVISKIQNKVGSYTSRKIYRS